MVKGKDKPKNLANGKVIGDFTLVKKLGEGTQAEVWEAIYNNKHIAIKIGSNLSSVFYDAAMRNKLGQHSNLFDIIDKEVAIGDYKIFPMELMKESLDAYLKHTTINDFIINIIGQSLVEAARYIKNQGYVFRDINPNNIMISQNNTVKLVDIGVLSKIGAPVNFEGTAKFSSHDALSGKSPSPWDDLYSVLLVLLYVNRGSVIWEGEIGKGKKAFLEYANNFKAILPELLKSYPKLVSIYQYLEENHNRTIIDADYDNINIILNTTDNTNTIIYNLNDIYQYSAEDLDNFIKLSTTDVYFEMSHRRYMTIRYLIENRLFDYEQEKLILNHQDDLVKLLESSDTADILLNKLKL